LGFENVGLKLTYVTAIVWRACPFRLSTTEEFVVIVATRVLKLRSQEKDIDIPIRVFAPEREDDGAWFCRYEIEWPDGRWTSRAGGADSVQALFLALQMIGSEIYTSDYHKSGQLCLEAPGRGYGFPVPVTLRNLLVGDDVKFL
jgi:hypothetical protein